jgi:hypothetical protein
LGGGGLGVGAAEVALGLSVGEGWQLADAADLPNNPRRPALLAALGMEVTS